MTIHRLSGAPWKLRRPVIAGYAVGAAFIYIGGAAVLIEVVPAPVATALIITGLALLVTSAIAHALQSWWRTRHSEIERLDDEIPF